MSMGTAYGKRVQFFSLYIKYKNVYFPSRTVLRLCSRLLTRIAFLYTYTLPYVYIYIYIPLYMNLVCRPDSRVAFDRSSYSIALSGCASIQSKIRHSPKEMSELVLFFSSCSSSYGVTLPGVDRI